MNLENKLRKLRIAARLSHTQAAQLVGVNQSSYSAWESGYTKPKLVHLSKLAAAFSVSIMELLPDELTEAIASEFTATQRDDPTEFAEKGHYEEVINSLKETLRAKEELIVHLKQRNQLLEKESAKHSKRK